AREHGHTFRFDLSEGARRRDRMTGVSAEVLLQTDSSGGSRSAPTADGLPDGRKVSALDIHRVADARAGRLASESDDASPDERRNLREQYY
ncbi:MAG: hypothetical protein LC742_02365, partial [Acidobacteria bacterium]|nr:hypothetical protein [Acidobacteriota bacterium]